jgi:putative ABC transport system permease protein
VARVGAAGLRSRPARVVLSALGIAIGIGAMIAVVGVSSSSRAELDRKLAALGANLLTVQPGRPTFGDKPARLPAEAVAMVRRIGPITSATATGALPDTRVYRNDRIPGVETGAIAVLATYLDLLDTIDGRMADGTWFNDATAAFPTVVLGTVTAGRLGIASAAGQPQIWLGGEWFTVVGILEPMPLLPQLDAAALIGWRAATTYLGFDGHPTTIYCRAPDHQIGDVRRVLAATANPEAPIEVEVSRPSDALAAKQATEQTFTALLLGLGSVALLVGGIGVANTMVITVLERRAEIGLRRALGATRGHIRLQFLTEALLLSTAGGCGGVIVGIAATTGYAVSQQWPTHVPAVATLGGIVITVAIGTLAGLVPAIRAARLAPTEALATP